MSFLTIKNNCATYELSTDTMRKYFWQIGYELEEQGGAIGYSYNPNNVFRHFQSYIHNKGIAYVDLTYKGETIARVYDKSPKAKEIDSITHHFDYVILADLRTSGRQYNRVVKLD